jgi:ATP-dependent DNA helicase RecG
MILEKCREQDLPEPEFNNEHGVMTITFYKTKWNEESLKKMGLNERQVKAVIYAKKNEKITNREYRQINNVSDEGARIDLNIMIKKDILVQIGKGRSVHYVLVK